MRKKEIVERIEEHLTTVERRLADAEEYIARNINLESNSFLHQADWNGKTGHPLWMKNFMIPTAKKHRAKKEKAIEIIKNEAKNKKIRSRKR